MSKPAIRELIGLAGGPHRGPQTVQRDSANLAATRPWNSYCHSRVAQRQLAAVDDVSGRQRVNEIGKPVSGSIGRAVLLYIRSMSLAFRPIRIMIWHVPYHGAFRSNFTFWFPGTHMAVPASTMLRTMLQAHRQLRGLIDRTRSADEERRASLGMSNNAKRTPTVGRTSAFPG